jgi:DNA adenine methylase
MQQLILSDFTDTRIAPFTAGLLKWVGSKQRMAHVIASYFPQEYNRYFEPFVGSGAILGTLAPRVAFASDIFSPLVDIWSTLTTDPEMVKHWYSERWHDYHSGDKTAQYEKIKASYNRRPNGADLLFLCRSCYGGIVRFRKADGYMSTPCGIHEPMKPAAFDRRVDDWASRVEGTEFRRMNYEEAMDEARSGDLVYCDPPYSDSQTILYGAQNFDLQNLLRVIERCKRRGVYVAMSIDGTKRSGNLTVDMPVPSGLFRQEIYIQCGRSMLRRFQMNGQTLEHEVVTDRLLLTY